MEQGRVDGADLQLDAARVHLLGERDLGPVQAGFAHVDGNHALARTRRLIEPAQGVDAGAVAARRLHQQPADAAQRVAARFHLAAVGVPHAHEGVGAVGGLYGDELVEADAGLAVGPGAHLLRRGPEGLPARLDDDEVVAEPVHLHVGAAHGGDI